MIKHLGIRLNLDNQTDREVAEILDNVPPYISKSSYTKRALIAYEKEQSTDEDKIVEKIIEKLKLNGLTLASEPLSIAEKPKKERKYVSKKTKKEDKEREENTPATPTKTIITPHVEAPVSKMPDDDEIVSNLDPNTELNSDKMNSLLEFLNG